VLGLGILREVVLEIVGTGTALKWFESLAMAVASGLLAIIAALSHRHDPANRWHWTLLALVFILLSMDEAVAFHEATMAPLREALKLSGFLYFSWVILAAPILLALALFYAPFMLRLPRRTALRFAIAGTMFVAGAFGLEFVGGYFVSAAGFESLSYKIAATCEETLEITGMVLFVTTLLRHLAETAPVMRVEFGH
jgi:hypothetical protein